MGRHTEIIEVSTSKTAKEEALRKWLGRPSEGARELVIAWRAEVEQPVELGTYSVAEVSGVEGARAVLEAMTSHAEASGSGLHTYALQWVDEVGKRRGMAKLVQVQGAQKPAGELDNVAALTAGDQRSQISLAQVQSLAVQRLYLQATDAMLKQVAQIVELQSSLLTNLTRDYDAVRRQRDEAESVVVDEPTQTAEGEAVKIVQQMLPMVAQAIISQPK